MASFANLSRRERLWLLLAGIVVVLAVVDKMVLVPLSQRIKETDQAIVAARAESAALGRTCAIQADVEREYTKYLAPTLSSESDEQETSHMLATVQAAATSANVVLTGTSQKGAEQGGWYRKFNVEVKATGTAESLARFLYRLSSQPASLQVDDVQLAPAEKNSPVLKAALTVSRLISREGDGTVASGR